MIKLPATLAIAIFLCGCGGGDDAAEQQDAARDSASGRAAAAPTVTEQQIIMAVLIADAADSAASALAVQRADAAPVRSFAQSMVRDHASINSQLAALGTQFGLAPAESSLSSQLRARGEQTLAQLQGAAPSAFDSVYVAAEIAAHSVFLNALDRHLVPSAQNADLKYTMQNIRRAAAVHLAVARQLQSDQRRALAAQAAAPPPRPEPETQTQTQTQPQPQPQPARSVDTTRRPPPRDTVPRATPPIRIDTVLPPVIDTLPKRSGRN